MGTMNIKVMREALLERRLDHVAKSTGVKKRTLQAIASGQSENPTYNVFKAIERYLMDDSISMLSHDDRAILSDNDQLDQIHSVKKTIKWRIKKALSDKPTAGPDDERLLISYAGGYGDIPDDTVKNEINIMIKKGDVLEVGKGCYKLNEAKK